MKSSIAGRSNSAEVTVISLIRIRRRRVPSNMEWLLDTQYPKPAIQRPATYRIRALINDTYNKKKPLLKLS